MDKMTRKIEKARKMSPLGAYPATWRDIITAIPDDIITALTSRQLVTLIEANQKIYNAGKSYNQNEINEFLGFDFWKIPWTESQIVCPEPEQKYDIGDEVSSKEFTSAIIVNTYCHYGTRMYMCKYSIEGGTKTAPVDQDSLVLIKGKTHA